MAVPSQSATSATLLGRLRQAPADQEAWKEFVRRYGEKIYRWARYWGLQESDAQDVTQVVLAKLADKLRAFRYDPAKSFRAWLKTVAHHAWSDFVEARRRQLPADAHSSDRLESVAARDDMVQQLDEEFDRELLEEAMARVRLRVAPHTWEAFRLTALEGLPGADVGPRVGMQTAMVFAARSKVQRMLRQEIVELGGESEP